jgi:hypothetical protein
MMRWSYRVFPSAAGWAWKILRNGSVLDEGVAPTLRDARVDAIIAIESLLYGDAQRHPS